MGMAVHAQYAFPHDPRAITRPALDNAMSASAFLGEVASGGSHHPLAAADGGNAAFSDLACIINNNNDYSACVAPPPTKRARVGDVAGAGLIITDLHEGHRAPPPQATSGRPAAGLAPASQGLLLSHLYRHGVEMDTDALIRVGNERLRAGLQEARRRHIKAVVSLAERAAARRLRAAEAELGRAVARSAELEERLRQAAAEGRAWRDVARGHEAVAAGLRAALDDLARRSPLPPRAGDGDAEDAESCCFEPQQEEEVPEASGRSRACRSCGGAEACVLVLPCRHLCLCPGCDAAVEGCPVCAANKNASLHVVLP
ncbi:unnamed protein product [Urochloa humidicola]